MSTITHKTFGQDHMFLSINKRQTISKVAIKMDNPGKLATYRTQDKDKTKTQHNRNWTPLYVNKHK